MEFYLKIGKSHNLDNGVSKIQLEFIYFHWLNQVVTRCPFQLVLLKQNHKMVMTLLIQHEKEISIVFRFYPYSNNKREHRWMVWDLCFVYLFLILCFLDLLGTIEEILPSLPEDISVWGMKDSVPQGVLSLKDKLSTASDRPVPRSHHVASSLKSPYLYIFTSGTTGMIHVFLRLKKLATYLQNNIVWGTFCHAESPNTWESLHPSKPELLRSWNSET